jgi:hypothetical protein
VAVVVVCGFNDWLLKLLAQRAPQCRQTIVAQRETQSTHKTDRRDASGLSEVLEVNRRRLLGDLKVNGLGVVHRPSADDQADRQLTASRLGAPGVVPLAFEAPEPQEPATRRRPRKRDLRAFQCSVLAGFGDA